MDPKLEELSKLLRYQEKCDKFDSYEEFSKYITFIASAGLDKLDREEGLLENERKLLLDQTVDLVYSNYKTFIHTADCSKNIYQQFGCIENKLASLITDLPTLKGSVESFLSKSKSLSSTRHLTSVTLSKHAELLEMLELPQIMETCVRNNHYDDAIQIMGYCRKLEKKHGNIPVIASIVKDVNGCQRLMLLQLVNQLRSSLSLTQCLKIIGLLRQLDVFSESELRLKFLQARDTWFTGLIKGVIKDDPYQHILKVIELSRVHLFDIVTQFRAIFSDDDVRLGIGSESDINQEALFHGWINYKIRQFFKILEADLDKGVGTNMESVLSQSMFFGQSFGRIGADFRVSLMPIFKNAIIKQFMSDVRSANLKFDEVFCSFSLMDVRKPSTSSNENLLPSNPPLSLMEFPPLAHYLNGILNAFSNLRLCCAVAVLHDALIILRESLSKVVTAIVDLYQLESSGFTDSEASSYNKMCCLMQTALIPHINICLRALFPLHVVSKLVGISATFLQKQNFGQLDVEDIVLPLAEHLNAKSEVIEVTELSPDQKEATDGREDENEGTEKENEEKSEKSLDKNEENIEQENDSVSIEATKLKSELNDLPKDEENLEETALDSKEAEHCSNFYIGDEEVSDDIVIGKPIDTIAIQLDTDGNQDFKLKHDDTDFNDVSKNEDN